jgi:hypothetical protein
MMTGGTSFIGSYVVRRLAEEGHEITVLARNPAKVPGLCSLPSVRFVEGTLTSAGAIAEALRGQEACIHIALGWGDSAVTMAESDTLPAIGIFATAADLGVRHLIYTSSVAVFDSAAGQFSDAAPPRLHLPQPGLHHLGGDRPVGGGTVRIREPDSGGRQGPGTRANHLRRFSHRAGIWLDIRRDETPARASHLPSWSSLTGRTPHGQARQSSRPRTPDHPMEM